MPLQVDLVQFGQLFWFRYVYVQVTGTYRNIPEHTRTVAICLGGEVVERLQDQGTDNHLLLWDLRPHGLTGDVRGYIGYMTEFDRMA